MAVVGAGFLLAVGRALALIHVEHDHLRRSPLVHGVDPPAGQSANAARFSGRASHSVSKRPIWLAEAADPLIARSPLPNASLGHDAADRHHSRPRSRPAARTPIGAEGLPTDADRSVVNQSNHVLHRPQPRVDPGGLSGRGLQRVVDATKLYQNPSPVAIRMTSSLPITSAGRFSPREHLGMGRFPEKAKQRLVLRAMAFREKFSNPRQR